MTRFGNFTNDELDMMEEAFCNEGFKYLVEEVRRERENREGKIESEDREWHNRIKWEKDPKIII